MRWICGLALALLFASVAKADDEDACARAAREGKCLVVIVSADWCPACIDMKCNVIDPMKQSDLKDSVVVVVDYDKQPEVAKRIMRGSTLPQVAVYRFKETWRRVGAVGKQSRSRILELLRRIKE